MVLTPQKRRVPTSRAMRQAPTEEGPAPPTAQLRGGGGGESSGYVRADGAEGVAHPEGPGRCAPANGRNVGFDAIVAGGVKPKGVVGAP